MSAVSNIDSFFPSRNADGIMILVIGRLRRFLALGSYEAEK